MERIKQYSETQWSCHFSALQQDEAVKCLESSQVLYFPKMPFEVYPDEMAVFSPDLVHPSRKNISYDPKSAVLRGDAGQAQVVLKAMMGRFAKQSVQFLEQLMPQYQGHLQVGRTSFRPVEIKGRTPSSYRKDDTRLHVDAFPTTPMQGTRILRLFSNIDPEGQPRTWRLGEPFPTLVKRFLPRLAKPCFGSRRLLKLLGLTRRYRTLYDHYMLLLHHTMKADMHYQASVAQQVVRFPAASTWMVFTDSASHAAMAGQYVLEQTFYIPLEGMRHPSRSPYAILQQHHQRDLLR